MPQEGAVITYSKPRYSKSTFSCYQIETYLRLLPTVIGTLLPIILPSLHMMIFCVLWSSSKFPVDRQNCSCTCWDTVFKGPYESPVGPGSNSTGRGGIRFKHMYFNSTWTTFKIWAITIIGVLALEKSCKVVVNLLLQRKLRWSMAFIFVVSIFSNYYAWWGTINYYNDDFFSQWYHQLFFTVSELVTTVLALNYLDKRKNLQPLPLLVIANIALFHIFLASWDQFVSNVLLGKGRLHQVLRDLLFMSTDIIYISVIAVELCHHAKTTSRSFKDIILSANLKVLVGLNCMLIFFTIILLT